MKVMIFLLVAALACACLMLFLSLRSLKNIRLAHFRSIDDYKKNHYNYLRTTGDLIQGLHNLTKNKEVIEFVYMIGSWIRCFPLDDRNDFGRNMALAKACKWTKGELEIRIKEGEFPSLTKEDIDCFKTYLDYWYDGVVPPYWMIELCSRLSCLPNLEVAKTINLMEGVYKKSRK